MTLRRTSPRAGARWSILVLGVVALVLAIGASALAVHDNGKFELDKNATNDLNVTPLGVLNSNITATSSSIDVCRTATIEPAGSFTILIEAERVTVGTANDGSFGGQCSGTKRTYTNLTRGAGGTTPSAHKAVGVAAGVSLLVAAPDKPGPDWNQVYNAWDANNATTCSTLGLVECAFVPDGIGPTTFTGGGSKDHLPISGWNHTSGASPDKAEILNAYAAKAIETDGDQVLYFGMDRYAVDGSTDIGFWFFKNPVYACPTIDPTAPAGVCDGVPNGSFVGSHSGTLTSPGDILLLGTFTQGGATTNIRVFRWVGSGGNESGTIQGPDGDFQDCVQAPPLTNDNGCATVNNATIEVPWNYTFKGSSTSGWIPVGGFYEGGVNLTSIGLAGCFSSFLAETRSSPEITAILKDFALGSFEACDAALTTTPANGTGTALTDNNSNGLPDIQIGAGAAGVNVADNASLNITGTATWSGTVSFFLCGPIADPNLCTSGGVPAGTKNVSNAAPTATSDPLNLTSVGRYCWRGFFDSNTAGVPDDTDASAGECFEVLPRQTTLDTQAVAASVNFGQAVQDNATLGNTANQPGTNGSNTTYPTIGATDGAAAGGKITFTLLKNDCSTLATGTGTNPQDFTPISGDNTYGPVSFTPDAPGTYHWKAQYFPATLDPNNLGSTHNAACTDTDETVVVSQVPTTTTTRQWVFPQDKAVVTATAGGNLAGNLRFTLHDSLAECNSRTDIKYDSMDIPISGASPQSGSTSNTSYRITDGTTHYWNVSYTSTNTAQQSSASTCTETTAVTYGGNDTGITFP